MSDQTILKSVCWRYGHQIDLWDFNLCPPFPLTAFFRCAFMARLLYEDQWKLTSLRTIADSNDAVRSVSLGRNRFSDIPVGSLRPLVNLTELGNRS